MPTNSILRENFSRVAIFKEFKFYDLLYSSLVLPFNMEAQVKSNWCWAATAKSVSHFYAFNSPWTQCKVASDELNLTCCDSPTPSGCNIPWYLSNALDRTQNYVSFQQGTISWQEVKDELDKGLVVGTRIGWNGGGGHFMVIYGVSRIGMKQYLHIDDPIYGKNTMTYTEFATNYQGSGTWTHTYFTKKKSYIMWLRDLVFNSKLLNPIPEVRPLARLHSTNPSLISSLGEPEYASAHNNYIVGLNDINTDFRMPERPMSMRIMEFEDNSPVALYEVGLNEESPSLIQMNTNRDYFNNMENALNMLKREGRNEEPAELRNVRIPALNLEAAWLHFENAQQDKFIILSNFASMNGARNKVMSEGEFREYLVKQKEMMGEMNEMMGA